MKINIDLLKDYRSDFCNEKSNFNSSSYGAFSSSYINKCSDSYVIRMRDKLKKLYQNIEKAYKNIDYWWGEYNNDVENLERALSHEGRGGAIRASSIRSYIDALPTLDYYSLELSGIINLNFGSNVPQFDLDVESISITGASVNSNNFNINLDSLFDFDKNIDDLVVFFDATGAAISDGWEWLLDKGEEAIDYAVEVFNCLNDINNFVNKVSDRTAATVEVGCYSVVEGVLVFGESLVDATAALVGLGLSIFNEDIKQDIQTFVSKEHVKTWFDEIYQTPYGQELVNNAYFFDTVRQIGSGIGYTFGVVGVSALTVGIGGLGASALTGTMTTFAGVGGFGTGTQNAWQAGADFGEGILTGGANAAWEAFQWWIGGKIGGFDGKIGKFTLIQDNGKISSKLLISLFKIVADAIDGGIEGIVQPLISLIYQDGYYDDDGNYIEFAENADFGKRYAELFDDAGGWSNVGIQTAIGGFSSSIGELFDLSKILRESKDTKPNPDIDVTVDLDLPNRITAKLETLDIARTLTSRITQPLDAGLNDSNNNQILESERQKIILDFRKKMRTGNSSDQALLNMLEEMAIKKGDEGFRILQAITRIKNGCPELYFYTNAYEDRSWWCCDRFNYEYKLQLQARYIDWQNYGTLAHELGHCLFDMVLGGYLPDSWDDKIVRAKINSSNNGTLILVKQNYDRCRNNSLELAYQKFEDFIMNKYGYTEKQYRKFLTKQFKQMSQNRDEIRNALIDGGLTFEQASKMAGGDIDVNKLVNEDIARQIRNFQDQIMRTQHGGLVALYDMIDAVSNGDWCDVYGGHGHGSEYYEKVPKKRQLHELIANFTSLKLNNKDVELNQFKEIFGTEFYNYLDAVYNSFLDSGKLWEVLTYER